MIGAPGGAEIMVLLALGVLLFGGKLPQIMRNLGRGVTEFRKGMQGIEDAVHRSVRHTDDVEEEDDDRAADEVPKFQSDDGPPPSDDVPKFQPSQ
jgi:sec-independent protein translocase protein TatA